jgi:hypothetical protein
MVDLERRNRAGEYSAKVAQRGFRETREIILVSQQPLLDRLEEGRTAG